MRIRAHLAEFGIVAPVGRMVLRNYSMLSLIQVTSEFLQIAGACLAALGAQLHRLKEQILEFDRMIRAWHRSNKMSLRLDRLSGLSVRCWPRPWSPASLTQRPFAQASTSRPALDWCRAALERGQGQARLASAASDRYLRGLFVAGALAVIRYAKTMAPNIGLGSRHCWRGDRPRSQPSRWPTRLRAWSGR